MDSRIRHEPVDEVGHGDLAACTGYKLTLLDQGAAELDVSGGVTFVNLWPVHHLSGLCHSGSQAQSKDKRAVSHDETAGLVCLRVRGELATAAGG